MPEKPPRVFISYSHDDKAHEQRVLLAGLYYSQGRYAEAEPLFKQAVAMMEAAVGKQHPHSKILRGNYEGLLRTMGRA